MLKTLTLAAITATLLAATAPAQAFIVLNGGGENGGSLNGGFGNGVGDNGRTETGATVIGIELPR